VTPRTTTSIAPFLSALVAGGEPLAIFLHGDGTPCMPSPRQPPLPLLRELAHACLKGGRDALPFLVRIDGEEGGPNPMGAGGVVTRLIHGGGEENPPPWQRLVALPPAEAWFAVVFQALPAPPLPGSGLTPVPSCAHYIEDAAGNVLHAATAQMPVPLALPPHAAAPWIAPANPTELGDANLVWLDGRLESGALLAAGGPLVRVRRTSMPMLGESGLPWGVLHLLFPSDPARSQALALEELHRGDSSRTGLDSVGPAIRVLLPAKRWGIFLLSADAGEAFFLAGDVAPPRRVVRDPEALAALTKGRAADERTPSAGAALALLGLQHESGELHTVPLPVAEGRAVLLMELAHDPASSPLEGAEIDALLVPLLPHIAETLAMAQAHATEVEARRMLQAVLSSLGGALFEANMAGVLTGLSPACLEYLQPDSVITADETSPVADSLPQATLEALFKPSPALRQLQVWLAEHQPSPNLGPLRLERKGTGTRPGAALAHGALLEGRWSGPPRRLIVLRPDKAP